MDLTTPQLCLLRSLLRQGCPESLMECFLARCGISPQEWTALGEAGLVCKGREGRWALTDQGKKVYRKAKVGRWF